MAREKARHTTHHLRMMADSVHQNLTILVNSLKEHDHKDAEASFQWASIMVDAARKLLKK